MYSFDPVGSYQRDSFKAGGSASAMLQPLLDNQVTSPHAAAVALPPGRAVGALVALPAQPFRAPLPGALASPCTPTTSESC